MTGDLIEDLKLIKGSLDKYSVAKTSMNFSSEVGIILEIMQKK